jgi:hypothetical protein
MKLGAQKIVFGGFGTIVPVFSKSVSSCVVNFQTVLGVTDIMAFS